VWSTSFQPLYPVRGLPPKRKITVNNEIPLLSQLPYQTALLPFYRVRLKLLIVTRASYLLWHVWSVSLWNCDLVTVSGDYSCHYCSSISLFVRYLFIVNLIWHSLSSEKLCTMACELPALRVEKLKDELLKPSYSMAFASHASEWCKRGSNTFVPQAEVRCWSLE